jgi:NitT/TauT family transport system permease protein
MRPLMEREWFIPVVAPLIVGVILIGIWQFGCRHFEVPVYLFPAPSDIAESLLENWPDLLHALGSTLKITFAAFALATILGVATAFLFIQSRWIEMSLLPYAVLLQVTPIVAVAPLIIILVKNTPLALTACATVIALFPIFPHEQSWTRADPMAAAGPKRAAFLHGRTADFQRTGADRRGGGGVRRRHRRAQRRTGV